eukprot:2127755-Rhodomonas_salina.7
MKAKKISTSFMDQYGSIFDGTHGSAFWYSFFLLFKAIATAIILAAVFTPVANAGVSPLPYGARLSLGYVRD